MQTFNKLTIRGNPVLKALIDQYSLATVTNRYNAYVRVINANEGTTHKQVTRKTVLRYAGNGKGYEHGVSDIMAKFIRSTIR